MPTVRSKETFEAIQWKDDNLEEIQPFLGEYYTVMLPGLDSTTMRIDENNTRLSHRVRQGDYLLKNEDGKLSICPHSKYIENFERLSSTRITRTESNEIELHTMTKEVLQSVESGDLEFIDAIVREWEAVRVIIDSIDYNKSNLARSIEQIIKDYEIPRMHAAELKTEWIESEEIKNAN